MNHDILDAVSYAAWRTTCLNRPVYEVKHDDTEILGKVTAVDYTSDKDHSSACFYVNLNPEGSEWIDAIRKRIDLYERQQRLAFNSYYGMYVEERPKFDLKNYLYFKNGEEMKMTTNERQIEFEFEEKKRQLIRDQESEKWQAKVKYEEECAAIDHKYEELIFSMNKEKEAAKNKEKTDTHAKAVKDTYEAYIAQGFTKTQAESFVKIMLENLKT